MCRLQFPTMAESCLKAWQDKSKTTSLVKLAKKYGATRDDRYPIICLVFDDDTTIEISGRGRNHQVEALLP